MTARLDREEGRGEQQGLDGRRERCVRGVHWRKAWEAEGRELPTGATLPET